MASELKVNMMSQGVWFHILHIIFTFTKKLFVGHSHPRLLEIKTNFTLHVSFILGLR